jgi:hypothetical protein
MPVGVRVRVEPQPPKAAEVKGYRAGDRSACSLSSRAQVADAQKRAMPCPVRHAVHVGPASYQSKERQIVAGTRDTNKKDSVGGIPLSRNTPYHTSYIHANSKRVENADFCDECMPYCIYRMEMSVAAIFVPGSCGPVPWGVQCMLRYGTLWLRKYPRSSWTR